MKKLLLSSFVVALALVGAQRPALAKDSPLQTPGAADVGLKPIAVLSISGYDRIISDLDLIGQLIQKPGLGKQADGAVNVFAAGLQGVDKKRPWGVVLNTDGTAFLPLAFIPVSDLNALVGSLGGLIGQPNDAGNGVLEFEVNNQKLYVKENNGWAYIGQQPEHLKDLPADGAKLLRGLDKPYELALAINVQNVPEIYRSMAIDQLKAGVESGLQPQQGEDEVTFQLRQKMVQNQMQAIEDLINEADQFTVGWSVDQSNKTTALEVSTTGVPNSNLAKRLSNVKDAPSNFSGFLFPKAAASFNAVQVLTPEDAEQAVMTIDNLKGTIDQNIDNSDDLQDPEVKAAAKEGLADILESLKATAKAGKTDAAASLVLGEKTLSFVVGVQVAKPELLEKGFNRILELAAKDPKAPKITFNAAKHGDVHFHTFRGPVPQDQQIARVLGENLDAAVGFGPNAFYLGFGSDALNQLKKSIDASKAGATKKLGPGTVDVALQPILEFAQAINSDPVVSAVNAEVKKSNGLDHLTLTTKPIKNGVAYRLTLQQGVLAAIGAAVKMQQGSANQGGAVPGQ